MKKTVVLTIAAVAVGLFASQQSLALGQADCEIIKIEKNIVTLDCGKKAKKLHVGKKAHVKEKLEGC